MVPIYLGTHPPGGATMLEKLRTFSVADLAVFIICECVGIPLCIAAGEAAAHLDYGSAAVGWGAGIPLAAMGFTFPFWSGRMKKLKESITAWVQEYAGIAVPA